MYRFRDIVAYFPKKLKRSQDNDHAPFKDNMSSVGWDLLCSTTYQIWSVYDYL